MTPDIQQSTEILLTAFNYIGLFVFAISGAVAGMRKHVDIFGLVVLAFAAACCGGILRDVLMGDLPPENITAWEPLATCLLAVVATMYFFSHVEGWLKNPVQVFDAIGLGLFTIIGVEKAFLFGIGPLGAIILGMLTALGGGVVRDILLARLPSVLRGEIYAIAAFIGASIAVAGHIWPVLPNHYTLILGATVCIVLRCLTIKYHWEVFAPKIKTK